MAPVTPIGAKLHERREQVLRRLLDAQNANDMATSLACFAHPRYELIGNQRVYDGADEVAQYFAVTRRYFPDLRFEVIEIHHGDDAVVCEVWMSGTHLGSGPDFEATGRRFRCRSAIIFSFDGEALVGARVYYDTGTIARQLA
ncbi:MAG TPA: ester cyclase [Acidimicrobiales bacterium]|nr:ester cyclase [Acidimicrobiales bacterium]